MSDDDISEEVDTIARRFLILLVIGVVAAVLVIAVSVAAYRGSLKLVDLNATCEQPRGFDKAAPMSGGDSTHPVYVPDGRLGSRDYREIDVFAPTDPKRVQLIACLKKTGRGNYDRTCAFDDPQRPGAATSVSLYRGLYNITVYEAHTGKQVGATTLVGDSYTNIQPGNSPEWCPSGSAFPNEPVPLIQESSPSAAQLRDYLAPYANVSR